MNEKTTLNDVAGRLLNTVLFFLILFVFFRLCGRVFVPLEKKNDEEDRSDKNTSRRVSTCFYFQRTFRLDMRN